jgi:hypothetical protein
VAAFLSYGVIFIRFPITRDVPWLNWLLFAGAGWLLWTGVRRARQEPTVYRGKIAGPILMVLSLTLAALLSEPMPEKEGAGAKPRGVVLIFYRGYW